MVRKEVCALFEKMEWELYLQREVHRSVVGKLVQKEVKVTTPVVTAPVVTHHVTKKVVTTPVVHHHVTTPVVTKHVVTKHVDVVPRRLSS